MEAPTSSRTSEPPPRSAPGLGPIFLVVLLDILGFSLVLPFLADEARVTFHTTAMVGTLLGSVYSLMQFLFVPVWGRMSDRIGRRPVLLWSVGATALGMIGLGVGLLRAEHVAWLFFARAFSGIATANLGTATAYIADVTKPEERARGMGLIGMAFGLGFILGPAIGGSLSGVLLAGRRGALPCFVAASLSLANLSWVYFRLRESLPPERRSLVKRSLMPLNVAAARDAFTRPGVALAIFVNFVLTTSFTVLDQTFRFFDRDMFRDPISGAEKTELQTGLVLAFTGIIAAGVQGGLIRPLSKRVPDAPLIRAGTAFQAFAFAVIALAPSLGRGALFAGCALLAVGSGFTQPSVGSFISKRADPREQGATLGTNQSAAALARMFGPALGGFLYGTFGPRAPFIAGSIGMTLTFLLAFALRKEPAPSK